MKDLESLNYFLGLEVSQRSDDYLLSQVKYAYDFLARSRISDSNTATTPLDPNVHLTPFDGVPLEDVSLYRQLVGSLIYLTVTRPGIAYVVHIVSQFMDAPRAIHYTVVLPILRYVKGTLGHGLQFSSQSFLVLSDYSNADWAGNPTDRRSSTCYYFYLGDSLISWRSKKQSVVSRSSTNPNIPLWPMLPLNFYGFIGSLLIWVPLNRVPPSFIVTIVVPYRLLTTMYFMNVQSTSKTIVTLFIITC